MDTLAHIHADIEERVRAIRGDHLDWPCCLGCDSCCRQLADVPQLTAVEWDWMWEGLAALPLAQFREIEQSVAELAEQPSHPIVCPLLDRSIGACRVYAHRPVVCRTYGFYVQHGLGLYCKEIESQITDSSLSGVVWGNQDAMDCRLRSLGVTRKLTDWFEHRNLP